MDSRLHRGHEKNLDVNVMDNNGCKLVTQARDSEMFNLEGSCLGFTVRLGTQNTLPMSVMGKNVRVNLVKPVSVELNFFTIHTMFVGWPT